MRLATIALTLCAAGTLAAGAAVAAKPSPLSPAPASGAGVAAGQCFRTQDIRSHSFGDDSTLLMRIQGKGVYRVTFKGRCLAGAIQSDPIVTRSPPGASIICKPIDFDVAVSKGGFPTSCIVDSIAVMPEAEVAALPKKLKP